MIDPNDPPPFRRIEIVIALLVIVACCGATYAYLAWIGR